MCLCPALHKGLKEDKRECDVVRFLKESAFWKTEHQGREGKHVVRGKKHYISQKEKIRNQRGRMRWGVGWKRF